MRRMMIRYQVKPDRGGENERYIQEVFAQLARERPDGVRYASFKQGDGVSFVHVVSIETADGSNPLQALDAFKRFTETVRERCAAPPVTTELEAIGAYRMLGDA
jgi:hypothetical protein